VNSNQLARERYRCWRNWIY